EEMRKHGVVNKFVEFAGDGLSSLTVHDRATVSNMCSEYGATAAFFPVDAQMALEIASVRPSVAGPKRPQDRVELPIVCDSFLGPKPTKGITQPGHTEGPKPIN